MVMRPVTSTALASVGTARPTRPVVTGGGGGVEVWREGLKHAHSGRIESCKESMPKSLMIHVCALGRGLQQSR